MISRSWLLLASLPLSPLTAQVAAISQLDEIVVTAQRREARLQDTPISITAVTAATIEQRDFRDVRDVARLAPNLVATNGPQGGDDANFFIRGVGQTEFLATTDPGVAVYVDGVYLGRTQGAALETLDLERIEVLRGPQGTLFGRNSVGGAVSLVSKRPSTAAVLGFGTLTVGARNRVDGRGALNLPVSSTAAVRLSGSARTQDGYGTRVVDGRRMGDVRTLAGRVAFEWQPVPALTLSATADGTHGRGTSTHNILAGGRPGQITPLGVPVPADINLDAAGDRRLSYVSVEPYNRLDLWGTALTAEWRLAPGAVLKSISAYRTFDQLTGADFDGSRYVASDQIAETHQRQVSQELQLTGEIFGTRLSYAAGLFYFNENITQITSAALAPVKPRLDPRVIRNQRTNKPENESIAGYGQATMRIVDPISLTLGARYTHERKRFSNRTIIDNSDATIPFLPPVRFQSFAADDVRKSFDSFTPRIAVEYTPVRDVLAYASWSKGFKSGGFNGRPANAAALTTYDPETLESYEVGVKSELFDRRLRFNSAAFVSQYRNIQLTGLLGGVFQLANAGNARIWGIETEIVARATPRLRFDLNLGYQENGYRSIRPNVIIPGVTLASKLPNTPRLTVAAGAEYGLPLPSGVLRLRGDYSYRSSFYFQATNAPGDLEHGYGLTDARLSYEATSGWNAAVFVRNAFDVTYDVNGQDARLQVGYWTLYPGAPREWGASIGYRF